MKGRTALLVRRPAGRTGAMAPRALAALAAVVLASCGDGGGTTTTPASAAPAPPPPPSPLAWAELPEAITVGRWTAETFVARLSEAVEGATYEITSSGSAATVEGESPEPGVFEGTVTGVEAGEVTLTLTASHPGYETATGEIGVVVEDLLAGFDPELFDLEFWRQMVFNALICPTGREPPGQCAENHAGLPVEERTAQVYSGRPDFVIHTPVPGEDEDGVWGGAFSESQIEEIKDGIRDAWEQLTGLPFTQTIRVSATPAAQEGWIDVWAVSEHYREGFCSGLGSQAGAPQGTAVLNAEAMEDGRCPPRSMILHTVGNALGFYQVAAIPDLLMSFLLEADDFSETERYHARLAFALGRGAPYTDDPLAELQGRTNR